VLSKAIDIKVGVVCDRGLNPKRPVNQDRYLSIPERGLFAVFDGVGGQRAGEVASQTAADTIEEALAHTSVDPSSQLIRRAVEFANRDIFELAESNPDYKSMATTVALICIEADQATIAHVGDSRVYRLEDGHLTCETIDHTDLNDDLRAGRITRAQAAARIDKNVINRALGVEPDVEVELKSIRIGEGARFLLCSDGIYKHAPDREIARVLASNDDPQSAAEELKRIAYERGADDNLTALVLKINRARAGSTAIAASGAGEVRRAGTRSLERKTGKLSASETPAFRGSRFQVEFGNNVEMTGHKSDGERGGEREISRSVYEREEKSALVRWIIYILLGLVLLAAGFYAGLRASDRPRNSSSDAPVNNAEMLRGREAFEGKDYGAAALEFDAVARREPQNAEARYWLGRAQLEQGEYAKAADSFDQAIRLQPELRDAYIFAAAAYQADGKAERADRMLRQYGERRRSDRPAQNNGNRSQ